LCFKSFFEVFGCVKSIEILPPEKVILGKSEDRVPKVLNAQQIKKLFEVQNLDKKSGIRDKAIIETLYSTGLRVSELVALNRDEINLDTGEFTVVGKGRKARTVYLSPEAIKWLKRYLSARADPFVPLFIRYSGKKMQENDFDGESLRLVEKCSKTY
jgi:site-specific recombinase XerD